MRPCDAALPDSEGRLSWPPLTVIEGSVLEVQPFSRTAKRVSKIVWAIKLMQRLVCPYGPAADGLPANAQQNSGKQQFRALYVESGLW